MPFSGIKYRFFMETFIIFSGYKQVGKILTLRQTEIAISKYKELFTYLKDE